MDALVAEVAVAGVVVPVPVVVRVVLAAALGVLLGAVDRFVRRGAEPQVAIDQVGNSSGVSLLPIAGRRL